MAFLAGVVVGSGMVISAKIADVFSWEMGTALPGKLGKAAFVIGRVAKFALPILCAAQLAFSAAANAAPFVAVAGIVPGLVIGLIAASVLDYLRLYLRTPGFIMEATHQVCRGN